MSEIVRPTRDGIHGREYISTSVDIGRKISYLAFDKGKITSGLPPVISVPLPLIIDITSEKHSVPFLEPAIIETAKRAGLVTLVDSKKLPELQKYNDTYLQHIAFFLNPDAPAVSDELLSKTKLVEIPDSNDSISRIKKIKEKHPGLIVSVRLQLTSGAKDRALELAKSGVEVIHVVGDLNGNEIRTNNPRFIKDIIREIHGHLIKNEIRDEVTFIAGGGIALAEHMAKAVICGADLVSIDLPMLIALECRLCGECKPGDYCPAKLDKEIDFEYSVGRMVNLMGAWHWQLVEVMGAMGMREARRLRGDVGRAMFKEELEKEIYEPIFSR